MRIRDEIFVNANLDGTFQTVASIERWTALMPNYRTVEIQGQSGDARLVELSAWYGVFPVKWQALQQVNYDQNRVFYRFMKGMARGMSVYWFVRPANNVIRVAVIHEMTLENRVLRTFPIQWLLAHLFFRPVIMQTLHVLKRHLEKQEEERLAAQNAALSKPAL